jgi:hypothetical protein
VETRDEQILDATDVLGKRIIDTGWLGKVTIGAEQAAGAFEVMSRFAIAPGRLVYLPPTMSPVDAARTEGYLEHPLEAIEYFAKAGVAEVSCQEKHMGSRAVIYLGNDFGAVHTRTGRAFFAPDLEEELLARIRAAVDSAGLWRDLDTDWLLLDAELLPWSLKAAGLIRERFLPVSESAQAMYAAAIPALESGLARELELTELMDRVRHRQANAAAFAKVVNSYAWPTAGLDGVQIAVFQVLASAGNPCYRESCRWQLEMADRLVAADPRLFRTTRHVDLSTGDPAAVQTAVDWWEELTASGGEGMVVKPMNGPVRLAKGLVQPGIKVRGREYLRITYGPDYLDQLAGLRQRNLGRKRALALREYALGLESIERLIAAEPLWRRHETVFAVLACEAEPTDPRL